MYFWRQTLALIVLIGSAALLGGAEQGAQPQPATPPSPTADAPAAPITPAARQPAAPPAQQPAPPAFAAPGEGSAPAPTAPAAPDPAASAPATQPATMQTQPATTQALPATTQVAATAPASQPSSRPANGQRGVTIQPGGNLMLNFKDANIDAVLDDLSSVAGFVVIKVVKPEGRVTLTSKQPVKPSEAIPLLNAVLRNAGYTAIQQGRILKIVARDAAKKANIPVRSGSDPEKIEPTDELVTQVIPLKYADATQLKNDLAPLMNPEADFTANASSNSLVMTDTSANIRRIVEIVAALDTSMAGAAEVKVFQLEYASAQSAAKLISDVFGEAATGRSNQGAASMQSPFARFFGGGRGGFAFGGPGGPAGAAGAGATGQGARQTIRVVASADDRTNTLVVSGPTDTMKIIERVVKELDSNPAADETVFVFHLKNAQASNIESVVNNLFNNTYTGNRNVTGSSNRSGTNRGTSSGSRSGTNSRTGSNSRSGSGSRGLGSSGGSLGSSFGGSSAGRSYGGGSLGGLSSNAMRTGADLFGQVTIIADPDTNSLLVRTSPKNYERVKTVLEELDRSVAQVLIKVLIAEVTHDNGIDIGSEFSVLNLRSGTNALGQKTGQTAGTNFNIAKQTGGLVVSIIESDFSATIRLLETAGKLDVLSRPYILASDNQLASITVGQEVPFITNTRLTETGQTINTIEYSDIGILLDVIPHINPEGLVILDVAPEISALTGTTVPISETVSAPVFAKRSAQSRVAIKNGQTVVIGGLMEDRKTETIDKVPLLGDIPWIGEAFKRRQDKKSKTELLIFLTPHVAQQPETLKEMSRDEMGTSKLVPGAVYPGAFDEHKDAMQRGHVPEPPPTGPTTRRVPFRMDGSYMGPIRSGPEGQPETMPEEP